MGSLFWETCPCRGLISAGSSPPGMKASPALSVHVSGRQLNSSATVWASLAEGASSGACARDTSRPCLNPIMIPPPYIGVPTPLKFLWFKRNNEIEHVESPSRMHQEDKELHSSSDDPAHQEGDRMYQEDDHVQQEDNEGYPVLDFQLVDTSGSTSLEADECVAKSKNRVSNLMNFRELWMSQKLDSKVRPIVESPMPSAPSAPSSSSPEIDQENYSSSGCGTESEECLEVPYQHVLHNQESFSKFLQDASLSDMKAMLQLSFLCNLAYTIPDIQHDQLLKFHRLKFITSSVDKKAEAGLKVKGEDTVARSNFQDNNVMDNSVEPRTIVESSVGSKSGFSSPTDESAMVSYEGNNGIGESVFFATQPRTVNQACGQDSMEVGINNDLAKIQSSSADYLKSVTPAAVVAVAEEETKQEMPTDPQSSATCPCEWYICHEESTHTRIFVVQGSESLASWQANLYFEPTKFEGLDVLVHRGIYDAANALYEQLLPEVLVHMKADSDSAQFRFTGHSLGGSLAMLLALMFQIRKVIPSSMILPVITFGTPYTMCGGDLLLRKLKLLPSFVQSVIMHRDVVPRAFACDYPDHVAEVLRRLNGRFRDHPCLSNQKLLYSPMGQIVILQPDADAAPPHPLLPTGHGLYLLTHSRNGDDVESATELRAAQRAFLNMPHPLEILGDPGAYGPEGAISRDHDSYSYIKAIQLVLSCEVKRIRRLHREHRRQLWWPLVIGPLEQTSENKDGI